MIPPVALSGTSRVPVCLFDSLGSNCQEEETEMSKTVKVDDILCLLESEREARRLR